MLFRLSFLLTLQSFAELDDNVGLLQLNSKAADVNNQDCKHGVGKCGHQTQVCCEALTPQCMACKDGVSEEEYCDKNPGQFGCPSKHTTTTMEPTTGKVCCKALTVQCLACAQGVTPLE